MVSMQADLSRRGPQSKTEMSRPTLEQLTAEEVPLQAAAVDLEGGTMPSCLKFFEHYFKCFGVLRATMSVAHQSAES